MRYAMMDKPMDWIPLVRQKRSQNPRVANRLVDEVIGVVEVVLKLASPFFSDAIRLGGVVREDEVMSVGCLVTGCARLVLGRVSGSAVLVKLCITPSLSCVLLRILHHDLQVPISRSSCNERLGATKDLVIFLRGSVIPRKAD